MLLNIFRKTGWGRRRAEALISKKENYEKYFGGERNGK